MEPRNYTDNNKTPSQRKSDRDDLLIVIILIKKLSQNIVKRSASRTILAGGPVEPRGEPMEFPNSFENQRKESILIHTINSPLLSSSSSFSSSSSSSLICCA